MSERAGRTDVVVVGAGLGGLAAAALLARAGRSVVVLERSSTIGGRAVTHREEGFLFNVGPHALYRRGAGMEVLRDLGVEPRGGVPNAAGGYAIHGGAKHTLPGGLISLLTTSLFGLSAKLEVGRLLATLPRLETEPLAGLTLRQWLDRSVRNPEVRSLLAALVRLSNYANAPDEQSAGAALRQLQLALSGNVLYLDGGWQTLVDGLAAAATRTGARIETSARVARVESGPGGRRVALAGGGALEAECVVIAVEPSVAAGLFGGAEGEALRRWAEACVPVRAACLDVGLSRLPQPRATFALGIDEPLYLSVHSARAKLAPEGAASIQVAKYLGPGTSDAKADEKRLEALLDLVQPGWRDVLLTRRFLPTMTVANAVVTAAQGGTAGRPGPEVPGADDVFAVGDWVGGEGMLADAALASARNAAGLILRRGDRRADAAA